MYNHSNIFSQTAIFIFVVCLSFLVSLEALAYDQPWECNSEATAVLYESIILNDSDCPRDCTNKEENCPYKFSVKYQKTRDPNAAATYIQLGDEFIRGNFTRQEGCDLKTRNKLALKAFQIAKYESGDFKGSNEGSSGFNSWIAARVSIPYAKFRIGDLEEDIAEKKINGVFDDYCDVVHDEQTCSFGINPVCDSMGNGINDGRYAGTYCRPCNPTK